MQTGAVQCRCGRNVRDLAHRHIWNGFVSFRFGHKVHNLVVLQTSLKVQQYNPGRFFAETTGHGSTSQSNKSYVAWTHLLQFPCGMRVSQHERRRRLRRTLWRCVRRWLSTGLGRCGYLSTKRTRTQLSGTCTAASTGLRILRFRRLLAWGERNFPVSRHGPFPQHLRPSKM